MWSPGNGSTWLLANLMVVKETDRICCMGGPHQGVNFAYYYDSFLLEWEHTVWFRLDIWPLCLEVCGNLHGTRINTKL